MQCSDSLILLRGVCSLYLKIRFYYYSGDVGANNSLNEETIPRSFEKLDSGRETLFYRDCPIPLFKGDTVFHFTEIRITVCSGNGTLRSSNSPIVSIS